MASAVESIPLQIRVRWLTELYAGSPHVRIAGITDDHTVDLGSEKAWEVHTELMRAAVARAAIIDGCPEQAGIDAVFTSEPYGHELAARFGATPVTLDVDRRVAPVSGTALRADPVAGWQYLSSPVRRDLALRVVVVGAESTGTTTLSQDLHASLVGRGGPWAETGWVPEIGRQWTHDLVTATAAHRERTGQPAPTMEDLLWTTEDFTAIAAAQRTAEDAAAAAGGPVLVCDTDAFATDIWHTRYLGGGSPAVLSVADDGPLPALYLLTADDGVPFVQDGIRDGEHLRVWMTTEFRRRLAGRASDISARIVEVRGNRTERLQQALRAVDQLVTDGWRLADPLG